MPSKSVVRRPWSLKMRGLFPIALVGVLFACANRGPPELVQAADAFEDMLEPINLSRSMFVVAFPGGKPSQFVSYLFSDMGAAEWPPSEAWAGEIEREQMEAVGQTLLPADVAIVSRSPDLGRGKQLVIAYDNKRGVVIGRGYVDPATEPTFTREWKLPQVEPAPGVEMIYQTNLELGMSAQSFPAP